MAAMMPVVHEEMHQGAGRQKQVWQGAEHMGRVLGQQEEARNDQKPAKHQSE